MWITFGWTDRVSWIFLSKYISVWNVDEWKLSLCDRSVDTAWTVLLSILHLFLLQLSIKQCVNGGMSYVHVQISTVRIEVFMALNNKIMIFRDVTPCSSVNVYHCSRGTWCYAELYLLPACVNLSLPHFWFVVAWTTKSASHVQFLLNIQKFCLMVSAKKMSVVSLSYTFMIQTCLAVLWYNHTDNAHIHTHTHPKFILFMAFVKRWRNKQEREFHQIKIISYW